MYMYVYIDTHTHTYTYTSKVALVSLVFPIYFR